MAKRLFASLIALSLSACAVAPTVYGPATQVDEVGYRETQLENNRFRVSFRANSDLDAAQVEDLAMRRAAELTLANNATWFRVVNRDSERFGTKQGSGTSVGIGGSTGSYGSSVGVGVGIDLSPDRTRYEAVLEILTGTGTRPDEARTYDAQATLNRTTPATTPE